MSRQKILILALSLALLAGTAVFFLEHERARSRDEGAASQPAGPGSVPQPADAGHRSETAAGSHVGAVGGHDSESPLVTERHPVRAPSFSRLLDSYDAADQQLLRRFDRRYRGALRFANEEQFRWMAEHGYPLPEDILEARSLTDDELRALVGSGDDKYLFLYADRVYQGMIAAKREFLSSGLDPASISEYPPFARQLVEANRISPELMRSESPFAGYVVSQFHSISTGDPYRQLAALHLAAARGDFRAYRMAEATMEEAGIAPEVGAALGAITEMLRDSGAGYEDAMPFGP